MKKLIFILALLCILVIISGCSPKYVDDNGTSYEVSYGFIVISKFNMDKHMEIAYDPETKICYIVDIRAYGGGICPYYIIGENGEPEIAVYNKNFKLED